MQVENTADTAANGTVSTRKGGGDGRVSEGVQKPLQSEFSIFIPQTPSQRPCQQVGGTTGRADRSNHADLST